MGPTTLAWLQDNGEAVKQLQQHLVKHGYMTQDQEKTGEGISGPRTKAAAFQQDRGLTPPPGQRGTVGKTPLEAPQKAPAANNGGSAGNVNGGDVPVYRQGDPRWGSRALGTGSSLSAAGCAMTATAMAISKISGRNIDPGQLDQYSPWRATGCAPTRRTAPGAPTSPPASCAPPRRRPQVLSGA